MKDYSQETSLLGFRMAFDGTIALPWSITTGLSTNATEFNSVLTSVGLYVTLLPETMMYALAINASLKVAMQREHRPWSVHDSPHSA